MYIIYQFKNCPIKLEFVSSKNLNCNFTDFDGSELRSALTRNKFKLDGTIFLLILDIHVK